MKRLSVTIAAAALFLSGAAEAEDNGILRISGSTTLLPVISKSAADFTEKYLTWNTAGAGLPKRKIRIFVSGGGSGFGVRSVINGTVHIGLASRNIKDKEKGLLGDHRTFLAGRDVVVIAARKDNPLARTRVGLEISDLARIFSGAVSSYGEFDPSLPKTPIVLYVRDSGAGSAELFQKFILGNRPPAANALQVNSQGMLLNRLESNPRAIGYISSGLAFGSDKLKVFALGGVMPTRQSAVTGAYALKRPLIMIVKGRGRLAALAFIDHVLSPDGQRNFTAHNFVPANMATAGKSP